MSPTQTASPFPRKPCPLSTSPLHITGVATFPAASGSRFCDIGTGEWEGATLSDTRHWTRYWELCVMCWTLDSLPASHWWVNRAGTTAELHYVTIYYNRFPPSPSHSYFTRPNCFAFATRMWRKITGVFKSAHRLVFLKGIKEHNVSEPGFVSILRSGVEVRWAR
jgi:hypothetical protein